MMTAVSLFWFSFKALFLYCLAWCCREEGIVMTAVSLFRFSFKALFLYCLA